MRSMPTEMVKASCCSALSMTWGVRSSSAASPPTRSSHSTTAESSCTDALSPATLLTSHFTFVRVSMRRFCFLLLLLSSLAFAQTAPKRTVIRAGHMLDVKTGKILSNVEVVVEGDRIVSVGTATGANAQAINLPNLTLLPGLIDAHTHLTGDPYHFGYQELGISTPRE